jgi:hypothetical protein
MIKSSRRKGCREAGHLKTADKNDGKKPFLVAMNGHVKKKKPGYLGNPRIEPQEDISLAFLLDDPSEIRAFPELLIS